MILILNRCKTEVPIVPVVIDGAFAAWPRTAKLPRPHQIRIVYGRPIPAREWRQWGAEELAIRVRGELVRLQWELHSAYAAESQRRLDQDKAAAAAKPARRRR
jgi:1-acyl-sn-glycerol-3-phosphate acyltransferase